MKSKGRVTYWAARPVGTYRVGVGIQPAMLGSDLARLTRDVEEWNRECKKYKDNQVELVRVEVTPT